jgi:hypothetical protein
MLTISGVRNVRALWSASQNAHFKTLAFTYIFALQNIGLYILLTENLENNGRLYRVRANRDVHAKS